MALYRQGTASLDANGVITGVDTKWRDPLSLIRTGATIIFLEPEIKLAVISQIISDTEMMAISTDGATVAGSKYVILLNDSLTVDGMAQDVAETLRYYQSQETVIAEAIEFFEKFDLKTLQELVKQVVESVDAAKVSEENAAQSAESALTYRNETEQLKNDTQAIKDGAVGEITSAKEAAVFEVVATKDSAIQDVNTEKDTAIALMEGVKKETFDARDAAEAAQTGAELAETGAKNAHAAAEAAKTGAESARDEAEELAKHLNPENLLQKDKNLSDVVDFAEARKNLDVPAAIDVFLKKDNLDGIADRAAAWLNVRPIGSTPLSGDPINDYDATTKRWVENLIGAGITGPTMNGVMNYGVGMPVPWISRAYIPPYLQPLDGQLLEREKYPDLWYHAQQHGVVTDAEWLADQTKRGAYSDGDGSTTFRLPDWNGIQSGSIPGVFFRGGNGAADMIMALNAAPNITGSLSILGNGSVNAHLSTDWGEGALFTKANNAGGSNQDAYTTASNANLYQGGIGIDASRSNSSYGRNNTSEVVPNKVSGVWCVRSSGLFTAARTSFNVINGDEIAPDTGTVISGGKITSEYDIAGKAHVKGHVEVKGRYLQDSWLGFSLEDSENGTVTANAALHPGSNFVIAADQNPGVTQVGPQLTSRINGAYQVAIYAQKWADGISSTFFNMTHTNDVNYRSRYFELTHSNDLILAKNPLVTNAGRGGAFRSISDDRYANFLAYDTPGVDAGAVIECGGTGNSAGFYFFSSSANGNVVGKITSSIRGLVVFEGSDRNWKRNIIDAPVGSLDRVEKMRIREYDWIDGGEHERGWIAQEMQKIDPQYVTEVQGTLSVSTKAIIADLIGAVQEISKQNKEKEIELENLKNEVAELKAAFAAMKAK